MVNRCVQFAAYSKGLRQMCRLHNRRHPAFPGNIGSDNVDDSARYAPCGGVVGASENFGAADGNIELGSQFPQTVKIDVRKRFLKPVEVQSLKFTANSQSLFVGVSSNR